MHLPFFVTSVVLGTCVGVFSLIAYDCESANNTISVISMRDVAPCASLEEDYKSTPTEVTVIQRNDIKLQEVKTCLVSITRIISYCGMHSHISAVAGGLSSYVHPLGSEECRDAHRYQLIKIHRKTIDKLVVNSTTSVSITLEGQLSDDGSCKGVTFIEEGHTWTSVIVYATIKIELRSYMARVKLEDNEISLFGGVTCQYLTGYCIDSTYGESVWQYMPDRNCNSKFSLLYQGAADLISSPHGHDIVVVEQSSNIFALSLLETTSICAAEVWLSEHPKILVVLNKKEELVNADIVLAVENLDLSAYINSKLLYIEQAYKRAIGKLYTDTVHRRCLAQREVIKNRLLMAPHTPNAISSVIKNRMGYVGRALGEVLYIMQCVPKVVQIRRTEKCYHELPISVENASYFMTPITHLIQSYAEEIDCSALTPALYFVDNKWIGLSPYPLIVEEAPQSLEIEEEPKLNFKPIQPIGSSGLYTEEEVGKIQKTLTFGMERAAVNNIIARKMSGLDTDGLGYSTVNLFNAGEMKKLVHSTIQQMWGWFSELGVFMSGLIGFYVVLRLVKYTLGVLLNGFAIYKAAGCGISILASIWNTLTLIVLHRHPKPTNSSPPDVDVEMAYPEDDVSITHPPSRSVPHWTKLRQL